jgi:hypothetical protein
MAEREYVVSKAARDFELVSKMPIKRNVYGVPTGKVSGWISRHLPGHRARANVARDQHFEGLQTARHKEFVANYKSPPYKHAYRATPSAESNRIQRAREAENARRAKYDATRGPKPPYELERH